VTASVLLVIVAAMVGGWRVQTIAAPRTDPGTLVVDHVSYRVTHADVSGMSHGIQGLVRDNKALITVSLDVSAGGSAATYTPDSLRLFTAGISRGRAAAGGSLSGGRLSANAHIEGTLSFVVPRDGGQLVLRARTGGRGIPLLQVDHAPAGAGAGGHDHAVTTQAPAVGPPSTNQPDKESP
jgi:hypothetical protein